MFLNLIFHFCVLFYSQFLICFLIVFADAIGLHGLDFDYVISDDACGLKHVHTHSDQFTLNDCETRDPGEAN